MTDFYIKSYNNIKTIASNKLIFSLENINILKKKNHKSMTIFWKKHMKNITNDNDFPFLMMNFYKKQNEWLWYCPIQSECLLFCQKNPLDFFILDLKSIISLIKLNKKIKIVPIHLNLTFLDIKEINHANTIILDLENKSIYIFEPKGTTDNLVYGTMSNFIYYWKLICSKINWTFNGYFSPNINYQLYDNNLCFLWTSWIEILIILNKFTNLLIIKNYLNNKYNKNILNEIKIIGNYLYNLS